MLFSGTCLDAQSEQMVSEMLADALYQIPGSIDLNEKSLRHPKRGIFQVNFCSLRITGVGYSR